jgi:predicted Fe-S protein YdhL (DUF1289 family)
MTSTPTIPSPCVGVCQINRENGYCLGCWRTIKELTSWARLDNDTRISLVEDLRQRQSDAGVDRRRVTKRRRARLPQS